MKTKQIIAGISAATVLAMVTPTYAGGLLGGGAGAAGALGGSMMSGIGGTTGQGAFDGRGAASTSLDRFPERPTPRAKPATTGAAHEADGSVVTALGQASGQSASTANTAGQLPPRAASTTASTPTASTPAPSSKTPSSDTASPSAPPSAMTSAVRAGNGDAQHSRGDNSVAVSGDAAGSVSRTQ